MSINEIVISIDSFHSENKHDIINSNSQYITKLFQNDIKEDKISEEALTSYYVDYYLSYIQYNGFSEFIKNFSNKPKILYYIHTGLKILQTKKHLKLFKKAFLKYNSQNLEKNILDKEFSLIQQNENLIDINHKWLIQHPQLIIINSEYIDKKINEHIAKYKEDKRHVKIIKQLCNLINEEFISITAGDINNIYNKAWHFKTTQGYYYMVEKNSMVTLFNSFTKEKIIRSRVISNRTEASSISSFFSKLLA